MKNLLSTIWHDSVWSKVIAGVILAIGGYLIGASSFGQSANADMRLAVFSVQTAKIAFPTKSCTSQAKQALFELKITTVASSRLESEGIEGKTAHSYVNVVCHSEGSNNSMLVVIAVADQDKLRAHALAESIWRHMQ